MNLMFVVAHPDDEVLGAGAFIKKSVEAGDKVHVVVLNADYEKTRKEMFTDIEKSHAVLGVTSNALFSYKNMEFIHENHRDIVETIEQEMRAKEPDIMFTHLPNDLHTDHRVASILTQQAARLWQRHSSGHPVSALMFMEVLSSTGWSNDGFKPDTYVEVTQEQIKAKIKALEVYSNVVRPMPHPRSPECVNALAVLRGSEIGYCYAEAFKTCWRRA